MNTYYVRAGCDGNGGDWNNALPFIPGEPKRGATYFVAGGHYPGWKLDAEGHDTVRIIKATDGKHGTDDGWRAGYSIERAVFDWLSFKHGYCVFDGQTGGGPFAWESGFGFEVLCTEYDGAPVYFYNDVSNVQIRHTEIHFPDRNTSCMHPLIRIVENQSNILFSHCWLHEATCDIFKNMGVNGFTLEYCKLCDNYSDAGRHGDGIEAYSGTNWSIRNNWFEDIVGTYVIGCHDGDAPMDWRIIGNIFSWTRDQGVSNGIIGTLNNSPPMHDVKIYHNSFINLPVGDGGITLNGGGSAKAFNNIWYNCPECFHTDPSEIVRSDYNCYIDSPHTPERHERKPTSKDIFKSVALKDFHLKRNIKGRKLPGSAYAKDMERYTRKQWRVGALERLVK